ncbi:hypothetical protein [Cryptosporangium arvum]|uniref:hypothetical protein n=1 Tax=Cryptosporangium arvum TaxID=80871 RepID=UPI0004AEFEEC|nr:hypothetical protein [Cryptosporangium arvum]
MRLLHPLALLAAAPLAACAFRPGLAVTALLWLAAGAGAGYQLIANVAFTSAVPDQWRAQAFGVVGTGLVTGQSVGVIGGGALAEVVAPHVVVAIAGMTGLLGAGILSCSNRRSAIGSAEGQRSDLRGAA